MEAHDPIDEPLGSELLNDDATESLLDSHSFRRDDVIFADEANISEEFENSVRSVPTELLGEEAVIDELQEPEATDDLTRELEELATQAVDKDLATQNVEVVQNVLEEPKPVNSILLQDGEQAAETKTIAQDPQEPEIATKEGNQKDTIEAIPEGISKEPKDSSKEGQVEGTDNDTLTTETAEAVNPLEEVAGETNTNIVDNPIVEASISAETTTTETYQEKSRVENCISEKEFFTETSTVAVKESQQINTDAVENGGGNTEPHDQLTHEEVDLGVTELLCTDVLQDESEEEVHSEEPIDQGKFKKKAALKMTSESPEVKQEAQSEDIIIPKKERSDMPEAVSRTGRIIKRKIFYDDEVTGAELDGDLGPDDVVELKKPRTKITPMRPVTRKPIVKSQMITLPRPANRNQGSTPQQMALKKPLITLRRDLIAPNTPKRITFTPVTKGFSGVTSLSSRSLPTLVYLKRPGPRTSKQASYDSDTDTGSENGDTPSAYKRRTPDDYFRAKYCVKPTYVCLHDISEFKTFGPTMLTRRLGTCIICIKSTKFRPNLTSLCNRWFGVNADLTNAFMSDPKESTSATVTTRSSKASKGTILHLNCIGTDSVTVRITQNDTTSSFAMNMSAYSVFAKNVNKVKLPSWPNVPVKLINPVLLEFPTVIDWQKHLPPRTPVTDAQKRNIIEAMAPQNSRKLRNKSGAMPTLIDLVSNVDDDVEISIPSKKTKTSLTPKKDESKLSKVTVKPNSLQCCVKCSQVYRPGDGHVCPPPKLKKKIVTPAKQMPIKNKKDVKVVPEPKDSKGSVGLSKKLKLCIQCNLVYSEDEDHSCPKKKAAKSEKPKKTPVKLNKPTAYQLCPQCVKIYREDEEHVCKKTSKTTLVPPAKTTPKPIKPPLPKKKSPPKKIFEETTPEKENIPEPEFVPIPDETPFTTMCASCSVIYQSNEEHVCGKSQPVEAYSVLCASCSLLYKSNETHTCVSKIAISPIRVSPIKDVPLEPKMMSSLPNGLEEVFSLPALDDMPLMETSTVDMAAVSQPELTRRKRRNATAIPNGVKDCIACKKWYKESLFAKHPCHPEPDSKYLFCSACSNCYLRRVKHVCPTGPTVRKALYQTLEDDVKTPRTVEKLLSSRVDTVKCEWCLKELLPSQKDAHDCPQKPASKFTYKCSKCTFTTLIQREFSEHACVKNLKQVYRCDLCPKMFSQMQFLTKHQNNMCPGRSVQCQAGCGLLLTLDAVKIHKCPGPVK